MTKVWRMLIQRRLFESIRARRGGIHMAQAPERISIEVVVRTCEPDSHTVECFDQQINTCPITSSCVVQDVLAQAQEQFLAVLDQRTPAYLLTNGNEPRRIWSGRRKIKPEGKGA